MCIIDHYPLGNQRTEISGGLNISEKLGSDINILYIDFFSNYNNSTWLQWGDFLISINIDIPMFPIHTCPSSSVGRA